MSKINTANHPITGINRSSAETAQRIRIKSKSMNFPRKRAIIGERNGRNRQRRRMVTDIFSELMETVVCLGTSALKVFVVLDVFTALCCATIPHSSVLEVEGLVLIGMHE